MLKINPALASAKLVQALVLKYPNIQIETKFSKEFDKDGVPHSIDFNICCEKTNLRFTLYDHGSTSATVRDDSADRMYAFVTRFLRENNYLNKDAH